jgi:hypothetical protein
MNADLIRVHSRNPRQGFLVCAIRALSFDNLVVNAEQQERRYPITDKKTRVLLSHQPKHG